MIDLEKIEELRSSGRPAALATVIKSSGSAPRSAGASMLVYANGQTSGTVGGGAVEKMTVTAALKALKKGTSETVKFNLEKRNKKGSVPTGMICGGNVEVFIDVYTPCQEVIVCGAGHIGSAISKFGAVLGWDIKLIDNRAAYVKLNRLKGVRVVPSYGKAFEKVRVGSSSAVVIVTHGHAGDAVCLGKALGTEPFYIGMIGSKTKIRAAFAKLEKSGLKIDGRVYSPVGLDLGGETPEEIAFCVLAEIMMLKHGASGRHLRIKK